MKSCRQLGGYVETKLLDGDSSGGSQGLDLSVVGKFKVRGPLVDSRMKQSDIIPGRCITYLDNRRFEDVA